MRYLNIEDEIKYCEKKYNIKSEIENIFVEKGYKNIDLSTFEGLDKARDIYEKRKLDSIVKVIDGNSDLLVLRRDNTTGILSKFIPIFEDNRKLKLFYNSKVFRNNINSNIEEINQLGVEYIGEKELVADKEIVDMTLNILNKFNGEFILEISNSKYILGLLEEIDIDEMEKIRLKTLIYYKNKSELLELINTLNISSEIRECLANILNLQGDFKEVKRRAEEIYINQKMKRALEEMSLIYQYIEYIGYGKCIHYDLSMIMKFDYYDGIIFKGYYPNYYKDIICGGRYDSFTKEFGKQVPAIGFSLDIEELTEVF